MSFFIIFSLKLIYSNRVQSGAYRCRCDDDLLRGRTVQAEREVVSFCGRLLPNHNNIQCQCQDHRHQTGLLTEVSQCSVGAERFLPNRTWFSFCGLLPVIQCQLRDHRHQKTNFAISKATVALDQDSICKLGFPLDLWSSLPLLMALKSYLDNKMSILRSWTRIHYHLKVAYPPLSQRMMLLKVDNAITASCKPRVPNAIDCAVFATDQPICHKFCTNG